MSSENESRSGLALGERLRAAREEKGVTREQAAEETRIPLVYLEALEEESFEGFAFDLQERGFLRNYASYLSLDPEELAALRAQARGAHHRSILWHGRAKGSRVPAAPHKAGGVRRASTRGADVLLAVVLLALAAVAALMAYQYRFRAVPEPTPTAGVASTPTATPQPVFEGTEYTLEVELGYAEHQVSVRERIDYTNVTSETLSDLVLNVHPNRHRGVFRLNDLRVEVDGQRVPPEHTTLDVTLRVQLPRELPPDNHVALFLDYSLSLPQVRPGAEFSDGGFGYSKRSLSLGNWIPVLAPYRPGKGWYALTYFPVGDPYVTDVADYRVTITTTPHVILAGTGRESRAGNVWLYEAEKARSFALAASDGYEVLTQQAGDTRVLAYYYPENLAAAEAVLLTAMQSLQFYGELFGPYPFADYRIAETDFEGGMEFSGLTFLGSPFFDRYDGTSRDPLIALTAHEAAHQWFFGLVGSDQVTEPWLDEAPAEYCVFLYYERFLPGDAAWWWSETVEQAAPTGKIDARLFEFRDNPGYIDAVYRRGAQFLGELRATMSDPAFLQLLAEYSRRHAYGTATAKDFFRLVRELTTADLVPLQEKYFRQRMLP